MVTQFKTSRIQWPDALGQCFSDSGHQIVIKTSVIYRKVSKIVKLVVKILEPLIFQKYKTD